MIELTEGKGYIALESAQSGDKFLVRGQEMSLGRWRDGRVYMHTYNGGPCAPTDGCYVQADSQPYCGIYTVREMQGMMMSGFFDIRP